MIYPPKYVVLDFDEPEPPSWRFIAHFLRDRRWYKARKECLNKNKKLLEDSIKVSAAIEKARGREK